MSMTIGLAGKPNAGKSTFFKAATLADVEIANYPFTTINANHGVTYVRTECPCKEKEKTCGKCLDGVRLVPIDIIDVAGLVPDAYKGRGLGNTFLDELRQAQAIIHVVDASGGTDAEGNPVEVGDHDPLEDVAFLNREITMWLYGILERNWFKLSRKIQAEGLKLEIVIAEQLAGAGIKESHVNAALMETGLARVDHVKWSEEDMIRLCDSMREISKPLLIAANKADVAPRNNLEKLEELDRIVVPTSAAAELVLKSAAKNGAIKYSPGDGSFDLLKEDLTAAQKKGLEAIHKVIERLGSTGVQECINRTVFELLDLIVVYPVEDEGKWSDKNGNMLPDAYLMKRGSTCHDLAYQIHTEIGNRFLYAVDARTRLRLGEKHEMKDGDVIKIVSTAK
ncbi:redox-regulated ATPase YchF [Methanosarcina sp. KYL-1]|uniref:redox-regulated ATPase YchF n=1 Tax=Methanosarcina sp. KYL-1 TaxID=2602068 RepID=UPI0021007FF5|nr:redox-regulated ATPase YchF [Methanosarcina sp. KYL-1]MCQ1535145.1 redox-regulated ATPase YchF [Methanosarcina sp. KYL-1]